MNLSAPIIAFLIALAGTVDAHAAQKLTCHAIHERLTADNQLVRVIEDLKTSFETPGMIAMEAELDGRAFSLRGDPAGDEFLLFITQGPDYTRGVVANASFNAAGQMRVSVIDGTTVHKLVCSR